MLSVTSLSLRRRWHHGCCAVFWAMLSLFFRISTALCERNAKCLFPAMYILNSNKAVSVCRCIQIQKQLNCAIYSTSVFGWYVLLYQWFHLLFWGDYHLILKPLNHIKAISGTSCFPYICNGISSDPKMDWLSDTEMKSTFRFGTWLNWLVFVIRTTNSVKTLQISCSIVEDLDVCHYNIHQVVLDFLGQRYF